MNEIKSKSALKSYSSKINKLQANAQTSYGLQNEKLRELINDQSIEHLESGRYIENFSKDEKNSFQKPSQVTSFQQLGGVKYNNIKVRDYSLNDSYDKIPIPSKRSLSTLRSTQKYDSNKQSQIYLQQFPNQKQGALDSQRKINQQNLQIIKENNSPPRQNEQIIFNDSDSQNLNISSQQLIETQSQIQQQMRRKKSSKKKFTLDQQRYLELKKQQEKIQEMMRNNYFYNNFALLSNKNPQYSKLKTRFPLFEMVVQDDDFMERLKRRKQDVMSLQMSLRNNVYIDQEVRIKKSRLRSRAKLQV